MRESTNSTPAVKAPTTLAILATKANDAHQRAFGCAQKALGFARQSGDALQKAKILCEHGDWGCWLAEHRQGKARARAARPPPPPPRSG